MKRIWTQVETDQQIRIVRALRRLARASGVALTEERLGLREGYFRDLEAALRDGRVQQLSLPTVLCALRELKVDPAWFFAEALNDSARRRWPSAVERFAARAAETKIPEIAAVVRRKRRAVPPASAEEIEALDDQRYDDPDTALQGTVELAPRVPAALGPELLGVYASCCRCLHRHREAAAAIRAALVLSDELALGASTSGRLAQRAGAIAAFQGDYDLALSLAYEAVALFAQAGEPVREARALVDVGVALGRLQRHDEAISLLRHLAPRLPSVASRAATRNRFTTYFQLAVCGLATGELREAADWAAQARDLVHSAGAWMAAHHCWLETRIAAASGDFERAEKGFRECLDGLAEISPVDAGLAGLELVELYLEWERPRAAREAVLALFALLDPLGAEPAAAGALVELLRPATAGKAVDAALVTKALEAFGEARARRRGAVAPAKT